MRDFLLRRALVPEGEFLMGSSSGRDEERPVHRVFVSAFEMALTPVTNRQYRLFVEATGAPAPPWWKDPLFRHPDQPVVGVSWFEAQAFCRWLSAESGWSIRLPTEAEREKACRGGAEGARFPWGDDAAGGGHDRLHGPLEAPERVGGPPNGCGLHNLADTVHEWCLDAYDPGYYERSPAENPCATEETGRRSARGGSWRHQIVVTPCAARSSIPPELHYADFGFRWIRVL